jgi:Ca-activated chloride channel family protein
MGAEDAPPSRLAVAVKTAESLLDALAGEPANRAAVAAFSGRGVLGCPLTENLGAVQTALSRLQPGSVRPGGTDLGAGLDAAVDAFGPQEHAEGRAIVVFSDGEDHIGGWRARLERLNRDGIIVHVVAIGDSEQGHAVPSGKDKESMVYQGQPVLSRRDDSALEAIARETHGAVLRLGLTSTDLGALYRAQIAPGAKHRRESLRIPERVERFPLFLAAAMGFLIAGSWPRGRLSPWRWIWHRALGAGAASILVLATLGAGQGDKTPLQATEASKSQHKATGSTGAMGSRTPADFVASGRTAYAQAQYEEALDAFEKAIEGAPLEPVPRYDAAATLFQLERYAEALKRYLEARERADAALRIKIDFALGNTALALGNIPAAIEHYDHCLASSPSNPDTNPVREDAAINRQFALEQARSSLASENDSEPSSAKGRNRSRQPRNDGNNGDDPTADQSSNDRQESDSQNPPGGGQERSPTGQRRTGGAGGASHTPPASRRASPDQRLDDALDQIRDAQRRRLPDEPPSESSAETHKDW